METQKDPTLAKILKYILTGWPNEKFSGELLPYANKKDELTSEQNCILWGYRIVIPQKYRSEVLKELHYSHVGIVKAK